MTFSIVALVIALISQIVLFGQLRVASEALKQSSRASKKSSELLALLELQKLASDVELGRGIELIAMLPADNWDEFEKVSMEDRQAIRMTVAKTGPLVVRWDGGRVSEQICFCSSHDGIRALHKRRRERQF